MLFTECRNKEILEIVCPCSVLFLAAIWGILRSSHCLYLTQRNNTGGALCLQA